MTGSRKAFAYESDNGVSYGVLRDESKSEATAGGVTLFAPFTNGLANIPTGVSARYVRAVLSTDSNIRRQFEVGRADVFAALSPGSQIVEAAGGLAAGGTYIVTTKVGERARFLSTSDTGQNDGDNP